MLSNVPCLPDQWDNAYQGNGTHHQPKWNFPISETVTLRCSAAERWINLDLEYLLGIFHRCRQSALGERS